MKRLQDAKILLIDGDPLVRMTLEYHFRNKLKSFRAVDSTEKGLAGLMREPWDLVLCDAHLPAIDGVDTLRIVAGRWPQVVPMLLVDHLGPELLARSVQAGVCGFIFKPIQPHRMVRSIEKALFHKKKNNASNVLHLHGASDDLLEHWARTEGVTMWFEPIRPPPETVLSDRVGWWKNTYAAAPLFEAVNRVRAVNQRWVMLGETRSEISPESVKISGILHRAALGYKALCMPAGISVDCVCPEALADVVLPVNGSVLCHILNNFFINAVHSLFEKKTGSRRIRLSMERAGKSVQVRFEDNGTGIPPADLAMVRSLGFTTRANGTGLGLFVADRLSERIGARMCIESRRGGGTTIGLGWRGGGPRPIGPPSCSHTSAFPSK
jgi:CheY-like chemotaxis protein